MIKITPETYKKMNDIFIKEALPIRIEVPTQERIDEWQQKISTSLDD